MRAAFDYQGCDVCRLWDMPHPSGCMRPASFGPIKLVKEDTMRDGWDCSDCGETFTDTPYYTVNEEEREFLCPRCAGPDLEPDQDNDPRRPEPAKTLETYSLEEYIEDLIDVAAQGNADSADEVATEIIYIINRIVQDGGRFDGLRVVPA